MAKGLFSIEGNVFAEAIEKIDRLNGDLQKIITDAFEQAGETIADDTHDAVQKANLPAHGEYSQGDTEATIIDDPKMVWSGTLGEMAVGFDKTKPGAGGFLITGTPKMKPDTALQRIYKQAKYANQIKKDINEVLQDEIERLME